MSTRTSEAFRNGLGSALAEGEGVHEESRVLAAKLATVERAYDELLDRVRGYERERAEIRTRLERILSQIVIPVDRGT